MVEKFNGTVKWYSTDKGYGFITPDSTGGDVKDVFVHSSALEKANIRHGLKEGQRVEFDVVENRGRYSVGTLKLLS